MKKILLFGLSLLITCVTFSQDLKIQKADAYFKAYRYADALPIYNELCFEDNIDPNLYLEVYRNASLAAIKSNQYWLALKFNDKMQQAPEFNFEDAYKLYRLLNFLGQYEKLEDLLASDVIAKGTGPRKTLLDLYKTQRPWENLLKDTSASSIEFANFNSGTGDFAPSLHPDGVCFSSHRSTSGPQATYDNSSYLDQYIYSPKANSTTALKNLLFKRHDAASYFDKTNQVWYYSKNLKTVKGNELTRVGIFSYDEKTNTEVAFPFNNKDYFVAQPYLSADGQVLYFSSDMPGGQGGADIWMSKRSGNEWTQPVNLGSVINTIEDEMFPYMNEDQFYFASSGHPGLGGLDLFVSTQKGNNFEKPQNLGYPLNSYGDDFALVMEQGSLDGYYTSSRKDFQFVDNIYSFKFLDQSIDFKAIVAENTKERKIIAYQPVVLKDENNKVIDTLITNYYGVIEFKAKKDKKYTLELTSENYDDKKETLSTFNITTKDTIKRDILLDPKSVLLNTLAKDDKTGEILPNTVLQFKNTITGEIKEAKTDDKGRVMIRLPRDIKVEILASKKGFIDKIDSANTFTKEPALEKEVILAKITAGTSFKIENVFYDFAKANLRPESMVELDKLAEFLLKNDNIKVELSSHTDARGSDSKNMILSQARAQSCVDYLLTKGIKKENIVAKGYGESKLINRCKNNVKCTEEEHQMNRRTEIKILSVNP